MKRRNGKSLPKVRHVFTLYVAGNSPNSAHERINLATLCDTWLPGRHEVCVVDVFEEPMRALAAGIAMTPTLVRNLPDPVRVIVGDLSDSVRVAGLLGFDGTATDGTCR